MTKMYKKWVTSQSLIILDFLMDQRFIHQYGRMKFIQLSSNYFFVWQVAGSQQLLSNQMCKEIMESIV